jgi:prepilin-type N-terminal cleavage/methylation domain-containing protein
VNDAGYTLSEMLAALAVIGLSVGGLSLGVQVIAPLQLSTSRAVSKLESTRAAQQRLEQWLARGAPFGSQQPDQLSGDATNLQFQCGEPAPCTAQILTAGATAQLKLTNGDSAATPSVLPLTAAAASFRYHSAETEGQAWPPSDTTRQALRSVALLQTTSQGDTAVLEARIWPEQHAICDFDPVMQDCR